MRLSRALGLKAREIITLVGAGGKTAALICLARELAAAGAQVVAAPATRMYIEQLRRLAEPVITADAAVLAGEVRARMAAPPAGGGCYRPAAGIFDTRLYMAADAGNAATAAGMPAQDGGDAASAARMAAPNGGDAATAARMAAPNGGDAASAAGKFAPVSGAIEKAPLMPAGMPSFPPEGLLVTCGSGITAEGKVTGLDPEQIAALAELEIDYLLLEGDGAAGALLKAPAGYEPVIPPQTTLVVTVAGLAVVGRPLAVPQVHRPHLVAGLLGRQEGEPLTAMDVARLLIHPAGGRKGVPPAARWVGLLNQAESYAARLAGREIAELILAAGDAGIITNAAASPSAADTGITPATGRHGEESTGGVQTTNDGGARAAIRTHAEEVPAVAVACPTIPVLESNGNRGYFQACFRSGTGVASSCQTPGPRLPISTFIDRIILGSVATPVPVRQVLRGVAGPPGSVGVIVLAAGAGERLGGGKQLLAIAGEPMVRRVVRTTLAALPGNVVVVLGHDAEQVAAALEDLPVNIAVNPDYRRGLSTSLQAGLAALTPATRAALFVLADQPGVTADVLTQLAVAYTAGHQKIVVPVYQGQRGNPVLIARDLWPQILALQGDVGAREIIRNHPEEVLAVAVDCPGVVQDIDTPADYQAWLEGK